jgi:uncharacterized protein (TIGR03000 family)
MTRRVILGAVAAAAMLTGPAAAQYAVRGGPLPVQRGPSLFTGAYAPSFYYGPGPIAYAGPSSGAGYVPNYNAFPAYNGTPSAYPVPQANPYQYYSNYYPQSTFYYPQPPRPDTSAPIMPPGTLPAAPSGSLSTGGSAAAPAAGMAHFMVKVPADAKLWVNDVETKQTGTGRRFHAPAGLEAGRTYEYVFRAQWAENGQTVTRDRTVRFKAGDDLTVDLTEASAR